MPVIGHQHITAQQESKAVASGLENAQQPGKLSLCQVRQVPGEVCRNEEDSIGIPQALDIGHGPDHTTDDLVATIRPLLGLVVGRVRVWRLASATKSPRPRHKTP